MIRIIRIIGMSALVVGLGLLAAPVVVRAQDSVFVSATGNVGIGTSSPGARLDVKANSSGAVGWIQNTSATGFSGLNYFNNSGVATSFIGTDNANSIMRLDSMNNYPIVLFTDFTERMRIHPSGHIHFKANSSGAVGWIQNTSATGSSGLNYLNNSGVITSFIGVDNVNSITRLDSYNNYPIVFITNWTERMRINSAGNVGIGTMSPSSKLHINGGDIRVSGGSFIDDGVTLNAPDYVFEPSYKLMPLEELREFVTHEKHLPNVPNAREVKEQGLNLSQFQMRLLEKVEELTLYALSQQEQIGSLHKENSKLKERLEALEGTLQQH